MKRLANVVGILAATGAVLVAVAVIAFAVTPGLAGEPTTIGEVKTIILRFDPNADVTGLVLTELEARIPKTGVAVTANEAEADAELLITVMHQQTGQPFGGGILGGIKADVSAAVRILSLPSHRILFSVTRGSMDDKLSSACEETAASIVRALKTARKRA